MDAFSLPLFIITLSFILYRRGFFHDLEDISLGIVAFLGWKYNFSVLD